MGVGPFNQEKASLLGGLAGIVGGIAGRMSECAELWHRVESSFVRADWCAEVVARSDVADLQCSISRV